MSEWRLNFDARQRREIEYCIIYAEQFNHGTDGHNIRLIVDKMARLLDMKEQSRAVPGAEVKTGA